VEEEAVAIVVQVLLEDKEEVVQGYSLAQQDQVQQILVEVAAAVDPTKLIIMVQVVQG
jgi:hypothetical protein